MVEEVVSWPAKIKVLIWEMQRARNSGSMVEEDLLGLERYSFW